MANKGENQLTVEQKLEIRALNRKKKELGITTEDIAERFGKSRQTISTVINDKSLIPLEERTVAKEEKKLAKDMVATLERIQNKVLAKIEEQLDVDAVNLSSLTKALEGVSKQLNLIAGKPTDIKETRKLSVDLNKLQELPPDQVAEYLATGDVGVIDVDYEVQTETETEKDDAVEVEATDRGA